MQLFKAGIGITRVNCIATVAEVAQSGQMISLLSAASNERVNVVQVVLFNWLGKPNRTTMLEKLHLMVSATNKDEREDTHIGWTDIFCQLVILVRDTSGPGKAEQIRKHLLDDEDIGLSRDRRSTTNRNTIRARLRSAFENVVVRTLPIPHPDITGEFPYMLRQ